MATPEQERAEAVTDPRELERLLNQPTNPFVYGSAKFGAWRRLAKQRAEYEPRVNHALAERRAAAEHLAKQAVADAERERQRQERIEQELEPERLKRRRQWLIDHPDKEPRLFDSRVWPLLKEQVLEERQVGMIAGHLVHGGYDPAVAERTAREMVAEKQAKAVAT